jgi:hypothetical protein
MMTDRSEGVPRIKEEFYQVQDLSKSKIKLERLSINLPEVSSRKRNQKIRNRKVRV